MTSNQTRARHGRVPPLPPHPDAGGLDRSPRAPSDRPDSIDYWSDRDRWAQLGKEVQADAVEKRRTGTDPAGAHRRLAAFRALGKKVDRRAR